MTSERSPVLRTRSPLSLANSRRSPQTPSRGGGLESPLCCRGAPVAREFGEDRPSAIGKRSCWSWICEARRGVPVICGAAAKPTVIDGVEPPRCWLFAAAVCPAAWLDQPPPWPRCTSRCWPHCSPRGTARRMPREQQPKVVHRIGHGAHGRRAQEQASIRLSKCSCDCSRCVRGQGGVSGCPLQVR